MQSVGLEWEPGELDRFGRGYPRPQFVRTPWLSLNGPWDFAIDHSGIWRLPEQVEWQSAITVPFAPEAPASGVGDTSFFVACWYRRAVLPPPGEAGSRLLLHFGAVDYEATVWVNGRLAGSHRGGYTPFCLDITPITAEGAPFEIVVRAEDDPQDLAKPRAGLRR